MHIDEHGVRHYSSVDEGRQFCDAIENQGLDAEYQRHQGETAMTAPADTMIREKVIAIIDEIAYREGQSGQAADRILALIDAERTEGTDLRAAITRSGLDLCPCRRCDALIACIPDGLQYCERCATIESQRQEHG